LSRTTTLPPERYMVWAALRPDTRRERGRLEREMGNEGDDDDDDLRPPPTTITLGAMMVMMLLQSVDSTD